MRLDLRRDFSDVYAHIAERVRGFVPGGGDVLGDGTTVKTIEVGFEYDQIGWLVVVFDTRADAEPDGEWTSLIDGNELERHSWQTAGQLDLDEPTTVVDLDGTELELTMGLELAELLGEMIKAVLLKARADGVFATLPKAPGCEFGVEHFSGAYGWPQHEDRRRDNLVD